MMNNREAAAGCLSAEQLAAGRPAVHLSPDGGWLNDPNGLVFFAGEYHVFYQTYPYDTCNPTIYWGHVKSRDLIHWDRCPLALAPDRDYDRDGCFTGSAIVKDNQLYLMYTGHKKTENGYEETQNIAFSRDGIHFEKYEGNPVIRELPPNTTMRFRDPKIWQENGVYRAAIGAEDTDGGGKVVLYRSEDLLHFEYQGILHHRAHGLGNMWECPNYTEVDGAPFLICSPKGIQADWARSGFSCGAFRRLPENGEFGEFQILDDGFDFYAPQVLEDGERRLLWAWFALPDTLPPGKAMGWAHALTLPRELYQGENNRLCMRPARELTGLRREIPDREQAFLLSSGEDRLSFGIPAPAEALITIEEPEKLTDPVVLSFEGEGKTLLQLTCDLSAGALKLTRGREVHETSVSLQNRLELRIFIDRPYVEIFVNDGLRVFSSVIYGEGTLTGSLLCRKKLYGSFVIYRLEADSSLFTD